MARKQVAIGGALGIDRLGDRAPGVEQRPGNIELDRLDEIVEVAIGAVFGMGDEDQRLHLVVLKEGQAVLEQRKHLVVGLSAAMQRAGQHEAGPQDPSLGGAEVEKAPTLGHAVSWPHGCKTPACW